MAIKAFVHEAVFNGYVGDPVEFSITVPYSVYQSEGGVDDAPRNFDDNATLSMAIGSSPTDVYAGVYSVIQAQCANLGYPVPTKAEMYGYAPQSFLALLPTAVAIS
jgi:hypothetical protein